MFDKLYKVLNSDNGSIEYSDLMIDISQSPAVTLIHKPTGIVVTSDKHLTYYMNRTSALYELNQLVNGREDI